MGKLSRLKQKTQEAYNKHVEPTVTETKEAVKDSIEEKAKEAARKFNEEHIKPAHEDARKFNEEHIQPAHEAVKKAFDDAFGNDDQQQNKQTLGNTPETHDDL